MAVVQTGTNEYTFYLDENVNNYNLIDIFTFGLTLENSKLEIYYENNSKELIDLQIASAISFKVEQIEEDLIYNKFIYGASTPIFIKMNKSEVIDTNFIAQQNKWYYTNFFAENDELITTPIIGFKIINLQIVSESNINDILTPYIGDLTSLPSAEPITQLRPFLKSIADSIRSKKGTTEPINAQNFASEIEGIETGGGLKGYSGTLANLDSGTIGEGFVAGLLEDGTLTTTFNTTSKYVVFVAFTNVGQFIHENVEYEAVYVYSNFRSFLFKPTADNWKVHWSGGGGAN